MKYVIRILLVFMITVSGVQADDYDRGLDLLKNGKQEEAKDIFYRYLDMTQDYTKCDIYKQLRGIFNDTTNQEYDIFKNIYDVCNAVVEEKTVILDDGLLEINNYRGVTSAYLFLYRLLLTDQQFDVKRFKDFLQLDKIELTSPQGEITHSFYGEAYKILADFYKEKGDNKNYIVYLIKGDTQYNYPEQFGNVFYAVREGKDIDSYRKIIEENYGKKYFTYMQSFQYIRNLLNGVDDYDEQRAIKDLAIIKAYYKVNKEYIDIFYDKDYTILYLDAMDLYIERAKNIEKDILIDERVKPLPIVEQDGTIIKTEIEEPSSNRQVNIGWLFVVMIVGILSTFVFMRAKS